MKFASSTSDCWREIIDQVTRLRSSHESNYDFLTCFHKSGDPTTLTWTQFSELDSNNVRENEKLRL